MPDKFLSGIFFRFFTSFEMRIIELLLESGIDLSQTNPGLNYLLANGCFPCRSEEYHFLNGQ